VGEEGAGSGIPYIVQNLGSKKCNEAEGHKNRVETRIKTEGSRQDV